MKQQTKRDLQASALVLGTIAGGTALAYFALKPTLQMQNDLGLARIQLAWSSMVINRAHEIAPEIMDQAVNDVEAYIKAGIEEAAKL